MANRHSHGRAVAQFCILTILVTLFTVACQVQRPQPAPTISLPPPTEGPIRVLFVGNSLTFYNNGINYHLSGFTRTFQAGSVSQPNYAWEDHWNSTDTLQSIQSGGWTHVILQEQSQLPVINPSFSEHFAEKLSAEVRQSGAEPILMMTWERRDSLDQGVTTDNLLKAYTALGQTLDVYVAPVGLAFARAQQNRPDLVLAESDAHPTLHGTYLAACVIYGFLMQVSPIGLVYRPADISAEDAVFLQTMASETLGLEDR